MVKAIFFDLDGVLTTNENAYSHTTEGIYRLFPDMSLDKIRDCYAKHKSNLQVGAETHQEILKELSECLGTEITYEDFITIFSEIPVNQGMINFCSELTGYKLGIITSNPGDRANFFIKNHALDAIFESIIISADVSANKMSKRIFQVALDSLSVEAEESAFIDNQEKNLTVPKAMGFQTYFYETKKNDLDSLRLWVDNL
jgi:putative hydrolase of the HAD superfamily